MARYRRRVSGKFVASAVAAGLVLAATQGHAHPGSSAGHGSTAAVAASYGSNEALANQMAASGYGWTGGQATCLDELWTEESAGTWSPTVTNPVSGAYGIPQALPTDKMASAGPDWQTSAATQVKWGLGYIAGRYGTPCSAWAFEKSHVPNWY
jgi:resuscitation-promoting factor RpfB